jgi:hypothetical protein
MPRVNTFKVGINLLSFSTAIIFFVPKFKMDLVSDPGPKCQSSIYTILPGPTSTTLQFARFLDAHLAILSLINRVFNTRDASVE